MAAREKNLPPFKLVGVDSLAPYARNARRHSPAQIEQIAASIREFGFVNPVLIGPDSEIIAGHGRVLAAKLLGLDQVPAVEVGWLSEAQRRAYILADNRIALNAGWDEDLLRVELADLQAAEVAPELLGFSKDDLAALFRDSEAGPWNPDRAPDPPAVPRSRLGDVWLLGEHRVICGDSTNAATVEQVLAGRSPHLMVTDPPYGVEYDPEWRNRAVRADGSRVAARATGVVLNDDQADWSAAWGLFRGAVAYVWHADRFASQVQASLEAAGFGIRAQVIWAKTRHIISRGNYHWQHEPCWYAVRKGCNARWAGGRSQTTLWSIEHQKSDTGHSTQKPVECMRRPIDNNSKPGDWVYDPFLGSGTTVIAAEMAERRCVGIELEPTYVDVIVQRWQEFTGEQATLEENGAAFDDLADRDAA